MNLPRFASFNVQVHHSCHLALIPDIAYFPTSKPPLVSQKRREAYEVGALIPCPMVDPECWLALPTAEIYGVVKIDDDWCTLESIAR